jgi:GNAT superfamily N-acetyltransferase
VEFARFSQDERLAEQRELFADAFPEHEGQSPASVAAYRWKFHGFPAEPRSYEYMATENGEMLGYYAAIPYAYRIGGQQRRVGMACDVMTHSRARGKGVFTKLGEYSLAQMQAAGVDFMTGYPIRPEVMGGHMRVGWQVAFELPMYLRPLRTNAILASRGLGRLAPLANVGAGLYQAALRARPAGGAYQASIGTPAELLESPGFDAFVDRWSQSVPNHLLKTPEFYRWRLGAPETSYQAFMVHREGRLVASAIAREDELHEIPSFAILDLMVVPGEQAALPALYAAIDREARRRGVEALVTMMSRHSAKRYRLARYGFLKSPFTFKLIVRSLNEEVPIDRLANEADWHLMWIDSDDL